MLKRSLFVLTLLTGLMSQTPANAHFYVWRDPDFKIDVTYPDDWRAQGGLPGNGRYKLSAPQSDSNDMAQCTLFAKKDKRYTIYPRDYVTDILAQDMQWEYWEQAVAAYDDLYFYYDNFGALNGGPARYTLVDYIDRTPELNGKDAVRKRAWVYGAIAGDMHVNVHCSSTIESFEKHSADFGQIIDSVSFPAPYATTYNGYYRDVLNKKKSASFANTMGPLLVYLLPRTAVSRIVNCPKNVEYPACLFKPKQRQILTR